MKNMLASAGDAGDTGSILGSERSPGGGNGTPLQYSCLGNPINRGACQATVIESQRVGHGCTCIMHVHMHDSLVMTTDQKHFLLPLKLHM